MSSTVDRSPAQVHTAALAALDQLAELAHAAQPYGAWYQESSREVVGDDRVPLVLGERHEHQAAGDLEDWIFSAATRGDAAYIAAHHPQAVLAVLAGRRRVLERHRPDAFLLPDTSPACAKCDGLNDKPNWPCPDYVDAAADLLPEGLRHG